MNPKTLQLITMCIYILIVIGIGVFFAKRSNKNSENFFIGGRTLGPWVAAMSAEASDMSGWLLMGLPGVAYWCGIADAFWTAIGLAIGTYANWLLVAKRLRKYSVVANNSITIPDFFSNRFREKNKIIMTIASLFILIFFGVYVGSCFATCGKLFSGIFEIPYLAAMLIGAAFVIVYTFLGGFLAESVSDFMQAIVMVCALIAVLAAGVINAGGLSEVVANIKDIPGFTEFFNIAVPEVNEAGEQLAANAFSASSEYGVLNAISMLAWGLGYFGMPQVLLRFIAIRKSSEIKSSRRIATVWCLISLAAAVCIGLIGRSLAIGGGIDGTTLATKSGAENVFVLMSNTFFHPIFAGLIMAGILAATISSSDSYLLISASAFSKNIYQGVFHKRATDKQVMFMSRLALLVIAGIGIVLALDKNSVIFNIVSFAWAGFGATFGPLMLFSLFWKRLNRAGAIAGMLSGAATVFLWKLVLNPKLGGVFTIYELLPAFIVSCIFIVAVSLATAPPSEEIQADFEAAKTIDC